LIDIKILNTDSIKELAAFWDTHDVTDFFGDLEEVMESIFLKSNDNTSISVTLNSDKIPLFKKIAKRLSKNEAVLISE
jgi:hypothetical protein